jgi:glutathione S-transferase
LTASESEAVPMSLELYFHPLASFCMKALVALYENDTPFKPHLLDLADASVRADFAAMWPLAKMPLLRDHAKDRNIPEATIIIEYLAHHYPGQTALIPADDDLAWQARLRDRFHDLYVNAPMQKVVTDKFRPAGKHDPHGIELAKEMLKTSYGIVDQEMKTKTWAIGDAFTMADCSAAPALYYANKVLPFGAAHRNAAAYLGRLMERPSFVRVLEEAKPYFALFPG